MIYSIATVAFLLVMVLSQIISFAYFHRVFQKELTCTDLPPGSVVLALGFEHLGERNGVIRPGAANLALAHALADCTERCSLVLTQKAVSDALLQESLLPDGKLMGKVPVQLMHPHQPGKPVRTLQALQLALQELHPMPAALVLMAHDKQIERAAMDLRLLYHGTLMLWGRNNMPYAHPGFLQPLRWSIREIGIARPLEGMQRMFMINKPNQEKI